MKHFLLLITIKNMRIKFPELKHLVCFKTKRQVDIQSPDPTTLQLRDRKPSNTAVYLFTDFDSQAKVPRAITAHRVWLHQNCAAQEDHGLQEQQGPGLEQQSEHLQLSHSSSEIPWDAKSVEKGFAADVNPSIRNRTVVGLRILLLPWL